MSVAGRRVVVAFAVVAVLFGAVAHRHDAAGVGHRQEDRPAAEQLVGAAPAGAAPVATRMRSSLDRDPAAVAGLSKLRAGGDVLAAALAVAIAVCWWRLRRRDRRLTAPLPRSSLAPLRAPPALV